MSNESHISRRVFLASCANAAVAGSAPAARLKVAIMSKVLQWLDVPAMAQAAASMGFDGIDLCVRDGAHVLPERVKDDLPRAAETIRKAGLDVPMITTSITSERSPHVGSILRTASALGIRHYRWGGLRYRVNPGIPEQLEALKPQVRALADLNRQHNMCSMYHTHSGMNQVGASVWDLWLLLRELDPQWASVNLDIAHLTIEGGLGGWVHASRLILPQTRGIAIKDFRWGNNDDGQWRPQGSPLGEGMVDWRRFFPLLKAAAFSGPVQMHYEYALGGAELGANKITISRDQVFAAMRRDLQRLRSWMDEHQL